VLGPKPLEVVSSWLNKVSGRMVPVWNPYMPKGAASIKVPSTAAAAAADASPAQRGIPRQVVYLPACVTRMMGPSAGDEQSASVHEKLMSLFGKAGYEVRRRGAWRSLRALLLGLACAVGAPRARARRASQPCAAPQKKTLAAARHV
jgi:hypothetical protein